MLIRICNSRYDRTKPVIDLSVIYSQSIEQEKSNLSNIENTPSTLCTTSANVQNHSSSSVETNSESREIFSTQDKDFLSVSRLTH